MAFCALDWGRQLTEYAKNTGTEKEWILMETAYCLMWASGSVEQWLLEQIAATALVCDKKLGVSPTPLPLGFHPARKHDVEAYYSFQMLNLAELFSG